MATDPLIQEFGFKIQRAKKRKFALWEFTIGKNQALKNIFAAK